MNKEQLVEEWYEKGKYKSDFPRDKQSFIEGYEFAEKTIRDSYNKYNSWLHEEQILKPSKRLNIERIKELEIKVQTLQELL